MNNQFATQRLREEVDPDYLENMMKSLGADEELIQYTLILIEKGLISPERAIDIMKQTMGLKEDGMGGGSTTGGGVTNGATFTPGNGEQYAMGTKKVVRKGLGEDAPRLAGGKKANISTYTNDGFTKAPSAEEAAKTIKGVEVKDLWGKKALGENYYSFRNETKTRGKSEQFHEAVKIINKKLDEVNKLLEFTGTLKTELSESEDAFEIKTNTKKSMDKVRGKVIEAYQKLKQL